MLQWASRCLPGFSIIALVFLLVFTSNLIPFSPWNSIWPPAKGPPSTGDNSVLNVAQKIFMVYTVLVHTNMLWFAARLSWSLWYVTKQTKQVLSRRWKANENDYVDDPPPSPSRKLPDPSIFKFNNPAVYEVDDQEVIHAIILPNYGEDIHTLITTLNVLASHPRARSQYEVSSYLYALGPLTDIPRSISQWSRKKPTPRRKLRNSSRSSKSLSSTFEALSTRQGYKERLQAKARMSPLQLVRSSMSTVQSLVPALVM